MRENQGSFCSPITAKNDPRVFAFGSWLRHLKIDELPQLFNILRGEMSIVGPRPEDPQIVNKYYAQDHFETLRILPGLASPGSLYNYTHSEQILVRGGQEKHYIEQLLPVKLALDVIYVREASFMYDLRIILRTIWIILSTAFGKRHYPDPPEMKKARQLLSFVE
jgi:lipopolysaccharide/colanic/teichoic acid biosynthesis glycosyltransferase